MTRFVLRWDIDTALVGEGGGISKVLRAGGFEWTASFGRNPLPGFHMFMLNCHFPRGEWECETEIDLIFVNFTAPRHWNGYETFTNLLYNQVLDQYVKWDEICDPANGFIKNGKVTVEYFVKIISKKSEPVFKLEKFSSPNEMNNVILVIEGNKLKVSKDFLAMQSPIFSAMFFQDPAEKRRKKFILLGVVYEEFIDLLHLIYGETTEITDRTVAHILKLSIKFEIERVLYRAMKHLAETKGINVVKKLQLADRHNITSLRDQCLRSFTSVAELIKKVQPHHDKFSPEMQIALFKRIMNP